MNEFAPPSGPPPPKVPEGWKAQWSEEWKEWFFVDLSTGKSTWEKPTAPSLPIYSKPLDGPSPGNYIDGGGGGGGGGGGTLQPNDKGSSLYSNKPYNTIPATTNHSFPTNNDLDADARLAQELQAEEDARARSSAPNQSYQYPPSFQQGPQQGIPQDLPPRGTKRSSGLGGLLSKLTGKSGHGYPQQQQYPQGRGYAGYPPVRGGGYAGGGGGFGGGMMPPNRRPGGGGAGMGMAGAGALGLGAGLVGGAMLADGFDGHDGHGGDGGGGDYGGGDGGGDYGGDYGGGDGGGDYGGGDGGGDGGGGGD